MFCMSGKCASCSFSVLLNTGPARESNVRTNKICGRAHFQLGRGTCCCDEKVAKARRGLGLTISSSFANECLHEDVKVNQV